MGPAATCSCWHGITTLLMGKLSGRGLSMDIDL
jgi:hypothetical protein